MTGAPDSTRCPVCDKLFYALDLFCLDCPACTANAIAQDVAHGIIAQDTTALDDQGYFELKARRDRLGLAELGPHQGSPQ